MEKIERTREYEIAIGQNGKKYVTLDSVDAIFHCTDGNSKTGTHVGNYNLSIEYTCSHACECYKSGACYACGGCYQYGSNQAGYSENVKFYQENSADAIADKITEYIRENKLQLFRYFTCGDIPGGKFMSVMVKAAQDNPTVKFWTYTKKYHIVNAYLDAHDGELPNNLVIIFSHWLNDNGSYFPMNNKYNLPTSEFIPLGKEELTATVTHICPCSDPNVKATCATCEHACYNLKRGESMALLEHSTARTKARDKAIKAAHAAL